jgi:hypothetical protein
MKKNILLSITMILCFICNPAHSLDWQQLFKTYAPQCVIDYFKADTRQQCEDDLLSKVTKSARSRVLELLGYPELERDLVAHHLVETDVKADVKFADYIEPNELEPYDVKEHLDLITEEGLLVSTGSERSFFGLMFCNKCTGLVVRDINPRIKAYVDFNTMLIRLSPNLAQYQSLTSVPSKEEEKNRLDQIRELLKQDQLISDDIKQYYYENLAAFSKVYFDNQDWKSYYKAHFFHMAKYWEDERLFKNLRRHALRGNIISTLGTINDLEFLSSYQISAVDSSNIENYVLLDFQGGPGFSPRIIWTLGTGHGGTEYRSYPFVAMTPKERNALEKYLKKIRESGMDLLQFLGHSQHGSKFESTAPRSFSKNTLKRIQEKLSSSHYWDHPEFGLLDMSDKSTILKQENPDEFLQKLISSPQFEKYFQVIADAIISSSEELTLTLWNYDNDAMFKKLDRINALMKNNDIVLYFFGKRYAAKEFIIKNSTEGLKSFDELRQSKLWQLYESYKKSDACVLSKNNCRGSNLLE